MTPTSEADRWSATDDQIGTFMIETCLAPRVVLDGVIAELCAFIGAGPRSEGLYARLREQDIEDYIAGRSALCYAHNAQFRTAMRRADPRPLYYAFVRHWIAGVIKEKFPDLFEQLPVSFRTGAALSPSPAAA